MKFEEGDDILLVEGLESVSYRQYNQKSNCVLSNQSFKMGENISKQEKVLGIGFLNAPTDNISYGIRAEYTEDSTSDHPVIKVTIQTGHSEETHFVDVNIAPMYQIMGISILLNQ